MRKSMEAGEMDATTDRAQDLLLVSSRAIRFIPTSSLSWINLMLAYVRLALLYLGKQRADYCTGQDGRRATG